MAPNGIECGGRLAADEHFQRSDMAGIALDASAKDGPCHGNRLLRTSDVPTELQRPRPTGIRQREIRIGGDGVPERHGRSGIHPQQDVAPLVIGVPRLG